MEREREKGSFHLNGLPESELEAENLATGYQVGGSYLEVRRRKAHFCSGHESRLLWISKNWRKMIVTRIIRSILVIDFLFPWIIH